MKSEILVYGAYGYTGALITDELLKHGIRPIVAGRNPEKIGVFARERGLPHFHAELDDSDTFSSKLRDVKVVIHCAGPFANTAQTMAEYCIAHKCHYLDITGEYQVFQLLQKFDDQARKAGIMLLPGAGFDVVPSDCLAGKLKELVPDANWLTLAFTTKGGGISRGTAKTMVEGVSDGLVVRRDGKLQKLPLGSEVREIDYGPFKQLSSAIPWGDIPSAYFSPGIPNITV